LTSTLNEGCKKAQNTRKISKLFCAFVPLCG
jgi:hypothetical protein